MLAPTIAVLGVRVSVIDQDSARALLFQAVHRGQRGCVTVTAS